MGNYEELYATQEQKTRNKKYRNVYKHGGSKRTIKQQIREDVYSKEDDRSKCSRKSIA
jgi:hypothetical protein